MERAFVERFTADLAGFRKHTGARLPVSLSTLARDLLAQEAKGAKVRLEDTDRVTQAIYTYDFEEPQFFFDREGNPRFLVACRSTDLRVRLELIPDGGGIVRRIIRWVESSFEESRMEELLDGRVLASPSLRLEGYIYSAGPKFSFITRKKQLAFFLDNRWVIRGGKPERGLECSFIPVIAEHNGATKIQAHRAILKSINLEAFVAS